MSKSLVALLWMCFAVSASAKLGETVPQLVKRFGKNYTVEEAQLGKTYKFRSASVSVDAVVSNGRSIRETYFSDHPLTASGEPPNDIVRAVLRTNVPKARWLEIEAAEFGADDALRSADGEYIAILKYTGPQPENMIWTMTVGLARSVHGVSAAAPSNNPSQGPSASPIPSASAPETKAPDQWGKFEEVSAEEAPRLQREHDLATSEFETGLKYYNGSAVGKNLVEAVKWFRKAAEKNYVPAQALLANCYMLGAGVPNDYAEAAKWLRKAAEQNNAWAQYNLGVFCRDGEGLRKDPAEAVKWFRKAAEQNQADAQRELGLCYASGEGVRKNYAEAVKWFRKAAEQNYAPAQNDLGFCYVNGQGVPKDSVEAVKWYRKAAEQSDAPAQYNLAVCYQAGEGVPKDYAQAVKWFRKAAEQDYTAAQAKLGFCYGTGQGVPKDDVEAYKWSLLAAAKGQEGAKTNVALAERTMSRYEIAQGQKLAREFKPQQGSGVREDTSASAIAHSSPISSGTGFFITEDGYLITNEHVAGTAAQVRLVTASGLVSANVVNVDTANDLALLKAQGKFEALPVAASRSVSLGSTVVTVGFPNIVLQGFAPKFARGEIASLSGPQDDPRFFQISVPLQPGNSGGALLDEHGNVIGVVSAKLSAAATLKATGELPENVNYAIKSSFLLGFLESVPEVASRLKEPNTSTRQFSELVEKAKAAAVLVLIY